MKKKKIVIIGAGVTGMAIAYMLCKKGHNVKIYETKSMIGGIMQDVNFDQNTFLSGPFFFQNNNVWLKEFLELKKKKIKIYLMNLIYHMVPILIFFQKKKLLEMIMLIQ